ncbi:MAG: beta-N-acetylhexosaminidase [Spirochaetes bacterium]|nr:beta-N-acetylhexosaminidase [Spirochaetota bacterium]
MGDYNRDSMVRYILRFFYIIIVMCGVLTSANCGPSHYERDASEITAGMSLEQKLGALMMISVPGRGMGRETAGLIERYHPGGVILFGFNIGSAPETSQYIRDMQRTSFQTGGFPLFISIDQEGGRVLRIVDGVTQFPGNMAAGIAGNPELVHLWARILGMQLRLMGVNMNLAPVLDVNNNPENPVINTRSFGSDPALVATLGIAYIRGLREALCIAVGKHFPGHGDTSLDSHRTLPSIGYGLDRLGALELVPFLEAIRAGVDCIMTAHIAYPSILGNDEPATVSAFILRDLLRKEMGFRGLVITDDLEMNAIAGRMAVGEGAVRAVMAGADTVLISTHGVHVHEIFHALRGAVQSGRIPISRVDESVRRIMELKLRYRVMDYRDRMVRQGSPGYDADDRALLQRADELNREISRKGILYHGDPRFVSARGTASRIALTQNGIMVKAIGGAIPVLKGFDAAALRSFRRDRGDGSVLFYHIEHENAASVRNVAEACDRIGIGLVVVSSANPFPVTRAGAADNYLLSFSNTQESVRQLGLCIRGDFVPRMGAPLQLGIPANRDR